MLRPDYMFLVLIDLRNQLYQYKLALHVSVYYYGDFPFKSKVDFGFNC